MEDPFTDNMEMASPYNGHVDDFEIDIDIMDDQPANVDNDFDLQDATPDGASGELTHDADMMDDVPEMTVTDTTTYNNDGNMQYTDNTFPTTQEPVESEMVDEEYEENTEAISTSFETFSAPQGGARPEETVEVVNEQPVIVEEREDEKPQNAEEVVEEAQTDVEGTFNQELTQEGSTEAKLAAPHIAVVPQIEAAAEHHFENPADENEVVEEIKEHATVTEIGAEHETADAVDVVDNDGLSNLPPAGETEEVVENEHDSTEQTPYLHQVKVIYQESEISMFPPRTGNTSETYFLADEGLAHESIGRLFKECRAILGEHASSEDSLVFHIDSLGIELCEDNTHVTEITLSQIVDTYLHLCRNSGIEQPEPLYLGLNTRPHLSSELAALLNAAKEGKGISDIQTWEEEYEHEETEDAGGSSRAELSKQHDDERDQGEHTHLPEEELQNESLDNEPAKSQIHETEVQEEPQPEGGLVDVHELRQAGVDSTDFQQYHDEEEDGEPNTAINESHQLAEAQADMERPDDVEEKEPLDTSNQEPTTEAKYQQQEGSITGPGVDEFVAVDASVVGHENQEFLADEHDFASDSQVEQDDRQEQEASTEDNVDAAELTEVSENATATEQYNETGGYEDEEEIVGQEESVEQEEGEYDEVAGDENYEDYAEEEYHQDDLQHEDDEELAGDEHTEELQEGQNDGSYAADQFDEASSKTVSASNEPVDNKDDLLDDLQAGTKPDPTGDLDYAQEIPDLPDLPDDDLLDLDDDIFADTEQATQRETENGNDHDVSAEQATVTNDDQQNAQLKRQGSTVGKRPRSDEEEEIDFDGGLLHASETHGFEGEGFSYLRSPIWWAGIATLAIGEVANFAAYAFAPAILVTPLGALSVLIGAVLGSYFLNERLGTLGKLGCAMCLLGSVVIVLHAPPDKPVESIEEILGYALSPGFLLYCVAVAIFSSVMIYRVAPIHGKKNPLIYISICSTVGSVSVMSIKAFGIALKLTFNGNNQFTHASTYVFAIVTGFCILTQMNYFNKALSEFSTNIVNPLYYVTFTTATLCASFILFKGFNTTDAVNTISLLCGFLVIFSGVYLLNLSRHDPDGRQLLASKDDEDGVPTDAIASFSTRRSMQARRSTDPHRRSSSSIAFLNGNSDREGLMRSYDAENGVIGLTELREEDDGAPGPTRKSHVDDNPPFHTKQDDR
ncbi:uncharacterized protein BHQ10_002264 [Talaromyces amestolkiae]|uniref:Uncharacterized protein n=1 Tax=Talaromyces amestolkiae TaxID=1196081 RepID=A0A364KRR7_TALAM|nr:uncharacterized protein BHQ10_002264 [Talaromyces amestolkiae]RAO66252.1 hypothetical protein BHQ10_002264 [Talaromyces amestolkiae]